MAVDITSAHGAVHLLYVLKRDAPERYETCHWPLGSEPTCFDVFESWWSQVFERPGLSYSAVEGAPMILTVLDLKGVDYYTRAWSVRAPRELRLTYVCQQISEAEPTAGMLEGAAPWVMRSTSHPCYSAGPPFELVSCPADGLGLFLAGASGIKCPFASDELKDKAVSRGGHRSISVMHPYLPVGGFDQLEFFSFDRDGGLGEFFYIDAGSGDRYGRQYVAHQFWPTADLPVRRVGLNGRGQFDEVRWIDGGVEIAQMPHLDGKFGRFREIVETSRGIVLVGEPPWPDGGPNESYRRYVLVSRDGSEVLGEYQLRTSRTQRIVETDAGIFVFRMSSTLGENAREYSVEYTQLPFGE